MRGAAVPLAILAAVACTETTGPNVSTVPGYLISSVIVGPQVDTLLVDPNATLGASQRLFVGIAFGKNGSVLNGVQFVWETSNSSIAVIDSDGLVTAVAPGTVEITASADKVGRATLVVLPDPDPPDPPELPVPPAP